jgi:hypothetical protein
VPEAAATTDAHGQHLDANGNVIVIHDYQFGYHVDDSLRGSQTTLPVVNLP